MKYIVTGYKNNRKYTFVCYSEYQAFITIQQCKKDGLINIGLCEER